jgi:hypothetical protein
MLDQVVNFFLVHVAVVLPLAAGLALVVSSTARRVVRAFLRVLARPLLILAVVALVYDGTRTLAGGVGMVSTSLADHWVSIAPGSLQTTRALVAAKVHPLAWEAGLGPIIRLPAWLVAGCLGLLLSWLGRRPGKVDIFIN